MLLKLLHLKSDTFSQSQKYSKKPAVHAGDTFPAQSVRGCGILSLKFPLDKDLLLKYQVLYGKVSERPKEHAWNACVAQVTGGSNPPLSE